MVKKNIVSSETFSGLLTQGLIKSSDLVQTTFGPGGRNVMLLDENGNVKITKDGVSVMNEIEFENPTMNIAATLLKQVAQKTLDEVGDGTTTSIILTRYIFNNLLNFIINCDRDKEPVSAFTVRDYLNGLLIDFKQRLKNQGLYLDKNNDLLSVIAKQSSNNDPEIYNLVIDTFSNIDADGDYLIKHTRNEQSFINVIPGHVLKSGFGDWRHISINEISTIELANPSVLFIKGKIFDSREFSNKLSSVIATFKSRKILVFAEDFSSDVYRIIMNNNVNSTNTDTMIIPIKIHQLGLENDLLEKAIKLSFHTLSYATEKSTNYTKSDAIPGGSIIRSTSTKMIIIPEYDKFNYNNEIINTRAILDTQYDELDTRVIEIYEGYLKRLNAKTVEINISARSEVSYNEKLDKLDDTLKACKAALKSGVVKGMGETYVEFAKHLTYGGDDSVAEHELVIKLKKAYADAISMPTEIISRSAYGISYHTLDPIDVVYTALANATAMACTMLTINGALISEKELN